MAISKVPSTMNFDNWRHNVREGCPALFPSYKKRQSIKDKQVDWHCFHCTKRAKAKMDIIRQLFGPRDANNLVHVYAECEYYHCPRIGRKEDD
jgi:hypothetical protein